MMAVSVGTVAAETIFLDFSLKKRVTYTWERVKSLQLISDFWLFYNNVMRLKQFKLIVHFYST